VGTGHRKALVSIEFDSARKKIASMKQVLTLELVMLGMLLWRYYFFEK